MARTESTWNDYNGSYVAVPWAEGRDILVRGTNKYLNFGSIIGSSGYGIRDNGGTMEFKNSAGAWAAIGGAGGVTDGDKGDIVVSSSGTVWTIDDATVGITQLSATGTPDSTKFLRGDNTWAVPAGGIGISEELAIAYAVSL